MSESGPPPEPLPIEPPPIDPARLAAAVRDVTGAPDVELLDWAAEPLAYQDFGGGSRSLRRVSGTARDPHAAEPSPWSMIAKSFRPTPEDRSSDDPGGYEYWRREARLYASGVLDGAPPGIRAPRCHGVDSGDAFELVWLEDVRELHDGGWSLERFGLAARHLGRFNGAVLGRDDILTLPWLSDLRSVQEYWTVNDATQPGLARLTDPEAWATAVSDAGLARDTPEPLVLRRLISDRTALLPALETLPRTLCHQDAMAPNLFAVRAPDGSDETVAIDWQLSGPGPLGAELAMLVAGSVLFHRTPGATVAELHELALDGYLAGLADVGVATQPDVVRFAAAAATVLRMSAILAAWVWNLADSEVRSWSAEFWNRPGDDLAAQWGPLVRHLEDQAGVAEAWLDGRSPRGRPVH